LSKRQKSQLSQRRVDLERRWDGGRKTSAREDCVEAVNSGDNQTSTEDRNGTRPLGASRESVTQTQKEALMQDPGHVRPLTLKTGGEKETRKCE